MNARLRDLPSVLGIGVAAAAVGLATVLSPQLAFVFVLLLASSAAVAAPAAAWVVAAVVATLTFRGLVQLGLLPSVATFADIGLSWAALLVAYLRRQSALGHARPVLRGLGALGLATLVAWSFHRSEVMRPFLYFALLGVPFALLGALLLDPPAARLRRVLVRVLVVLIAIQIPIAFAQAAGHLVSGRGDPVQGTLYGAGAGTDTMSAVVVVGALWLLAETRGITTWWRVLFVALAFAVPVVADAKQVLLALPAGVLAVSPRRPRTFLLQALAVVGSILALFEFGAGHAAANYLRESQHGRGGKQIAAEFVWGKLRGDPSSIVFGLGPAETVSRAAFMTTPLLLSQGSPLHVFGLKPAPVAMEAESRALVVSGGGTSFNSGISSALRVVGDLGIVGVLVYLALPVWIIRSLRRSPATVAIPAASGWGSLLVLGLVFDWWEQPPFGIVLAVLTGLALAGVAREHDSPLHTQPHERDA